MTREDWEEIHGGRDAHWEDEEGSGSCLNGVAVLCFAAAILWAMWKAGDSWGWW